MRHKQRTQSALSMVSYLFLLVGLIAFFGMVFHVVEGSFHFSFGNIGVLGMGIFAGLRRYSRAWRVCALAFTWYGIITLSVALILCLADRPSAATPILFSHRFAYIPADWLAIPLIMILLVTLWQYRVLTHPAVRRLFDQAPRPSNVPPPASVGAELDEVV